MDDSAPREHTANLLGALALVLHDRMVEALEYPENAAAALSALLHFLHEPSVDRMHTVIGLTPSGTVRMIDRLESDGHLTRGPGEDGRTRSVRLTRRGRAAARRVRDARGDVLQSALEPLTAQEISTLESLLSRLLVGTMRGPGAQRWMCRLCDMGACGRDEGNCPVAIAARERWGAGRS
jgi:DNA-binding MarR family transcriptional regulator